MASQNNNKSTGETFQSQFCVMATGCLSLVRVPEFKGLDTVKGNIHHIAN